MAKQQRGPAMNVRAAENGRVEEPAQEAPRPGLGRPGALAREVNRALAAAGHTVAAAESLTSGGLCEALGDAPGAAATFVGGIVAYSTDLKERLLGVDGALLERVGAIHPEVARQMAQGIRTITRATYGVATTGVAGPAPQDGQDVGTVFVAVATPHTTTAIRARPSTHDRSGIQHAAVLAALQLLHDRLRPPR
ncbi:CinA family protein [Kitasatospora sp. NPDC054795]